MLSDPQFPVQLFRFCPSCGQPMAVGGMSKSICCQACGFLLYFNSSAAVAAIIVNSVSEVLFTLRRFDPAKGMLDLPGGFVDPGETAEEALVREIREELNLKLVSYTYLGSFANTYRFAGVLYHTTDLVYVCHVDDFTTLRAADDVSGFVFKAPDREIEPQIGLDSIRRAVAVFRQKVE